MKMSGTEKRSFNVHRHQSKCKHFNMYDRLLEDMSVSDLAKGAVDALYSLHARQGDIEQLRKSFNERLTAQFVPGLTASAVNVPLFREEEREKEPPF